MKNITKHNRPINTVLKEYIERQKGKVVEARKELQRRFYGLDWNIQKKILVAHLKSSKSDREWAYSLLLNYCSKIGGKGISSICSTISSPQKGPNPQTFLKLSSLVYIHIFHALLSQPSPRYCLAAIYSVPASPRKNSL